MGNIKGPDFEAIYQKYLAWFHEHAVAGASPMAREEVLEYHIFHEDIFENSICLLNRMYFLIPLPPMRSRNGMWKNFCFSELNLMVKSPRENEVIDILPVEYHVE